MSPEKVVMMAGHIAPFFNTQPGIDPAEAVADHLRDVWEPRTRRQPAGDVAAGGQGLDATV